MRNLTGYRTTRVALLLASCLAIPQSARALSPMPAPDPQPVTFSAEQEDLIGKIALRYLQAHPQALAQALAHAPRPSAAGPAGVRPAEPTLASEAGAGATRAPCAPCPGNDR